MATRKMVLNNLVRNSIAAYFAAIEIHNKPNIPYRYETVTLLMMNAWELILKAYVKKYLKKKSIYTKDGHTITIDKALGYVNEHRNSLKKNSFTAITKNIEEIEHYRNNITHFYCEDLEPYIFMLVARTALNYVEFLKEFFGKDIMADEGLFIIPLGFKLPFRPEDFLSGKVAKLAVTEEAKSFINEIICTIKMLQADGIEDSIVLGFDLYFESVKKATNSSILASITSLDDAEVSFAKVSTVRLSADASQIVNMTDSEFRTIWKYSYGEVVAWCKQNIDGFKLDRRFHEAKKSMFLDTTYVYERKLDSNNSKSASQKFYTDAALDRLKELLGQNDNR